jgi:hypothetical protein
MRACLAPRRVNAGGGVVVTGAASRVRFSQWMVGLALLGVVGVAQPVQATNYEPEDPTPRVPAAPRPELRKPAKPPPAPPAPSATDFAVGPTGSVGGSDIQAPRRSTPGTRPDARGTGTPREPPSRAGKARAAEPTTLTVKGPTVVILQGSAADLDKMRDDEAFKDFRSGFEANVSRFIEGMKAHPQVRVVRSSADVIRFVDPKLPPVQRYSVDNGHGYVFYQPGAPARVFGNVRSGDGLLCEAARTFRWKPAPPNCDVGP